MKDIFEGLLAYCAPQKILIIKRLKFFQHEQLSGETFDNFFIKLRKQANCDFGELTKNLLSIRIVFGI